MREATITILWVSGLRIEALTPCADDLTTAFVVTSVSSSRTLPSCPSAERLDTLLCASHDTSYLPGGWKGAAGVSKQHTATEPEQGQGLPPA
jgi:hypothetical protein